ETRLEIFCDQKATLILAVLSDKNLQGMCEALAPIANLVLLPKIRSERAAHPQALARVLSSIAPALPYSITPSLADALTRACAEPTIILLTSSMHFALEALTHLHKLPASLEVFAQ